MSNKKFELPTVPLRYQDINLQTLKHKLSFKRSPPRNSIPESTRQPYLLKESISPTRYSSKSQLEINDLHLSTINHVESSRITVFERLSQSTPTPGPGCYYQDSGEKPQIIRKSMVERWKKQMEGPNQEFLPGLQVQQWKQKQVQINKVERGLIKPVPQYKTGRSASRTLRILGFTGNFKW